VVFVRTVQTASDAGAVQIVYSRRQGARRIAQPSRHRSASDHRVRRFGCLSLDRAHHRLVDQKFVKTMRRYRTVEIQSRDHTITAADPLPPGAHTALEAIRANPGRH
jgi:hypothetical protein